MAHRDTLLALAIAAAAFAVHQGVLDNGFVRFDDATYVAENPIVRQGLTVDGVRWAFSTFKKSNYHPLTWLSHMADAELYGLDPSGHHATSLLLHVLNSLLVFWVFRRATGEPIASAIVAGLFAIHPTHVESVAWVSERKDVLSTAFGMLAMGVYVGARNATRGRMGAVAGLFALSLLAKPMLVTLPAVLLLFDFWPLRRLGSARNLSALLAEKWPLWALSAAVCVVTIVAQDRALGLASEAGPGVRAANAVVSYGRYVALTLWPSGLSVLYPHPTLGGVTAPLWQLTLIGVGLAGATALFVRARNRPYLAFGWLWFGGTLVPVIGLLQVGFQAMADRYLYVPSLGLYVMIAWGGLEVWRRLRATRPSLAHGLAGAAAAWAVALAALAVDQVSAWRDTETLFVRSLAAAPGAFILHANLGNEYWSLERREEAIEQYRRAVEIAPDYAPGREGLIEALLAVRDLPGAIEAIRGRLLVHPDDVGERTRLAHLLRMTGALDEAIVEYRAVADARPGSAAPKRNLAGALLEAGRREEGIAALERALELDPDHPESAALLERARGS